MDMDQGAPTTPPPQDPPLRTEGPPLRTKRPYSALARVEGEAARLLWANHLSYNEAIRRLADGLTTAAAAAARPRPGEGPEGAGALAAAWFTAEPEGQAPAGFVCDRGELAGRFAAHLAEAGVAPEDIPPWASEAAIWLEAPLRPGSAWVDRRAMAGSGACPPLPAGEEILSLLADHARGADVTKAVGGWWSRTRGEGAKADWEAVGRATEALRRALRAGGAATVAALARAVTGESDPAGLAEALETHKPNALSGLVRRLAAQRGAEAPLEEKALEDLGRLADQRAALIEGRLRNDRALEAARRGGEALLSDWAASVLVGSGLYPSEEALDHAGAVEALVQAVVVARSHQAKAALRVAERLALRAKAQELRAGLDPAHAAGLDALCRRRGEELGLGRPWLPGRRAIRGWAAAVRAMSALPEDAGEDERWAAAASSCGEGDGAFLGAVVRECRGLVDDEIARWRAEAAKEGKAKARRRGRGRGKGRGGQEEPRSHLGEYVAWCEALRRLERFVAPTLTLPDPLRAPRAPWYGNSKAAGSVSPDGTFSVWTPRGRAAGRWESRRIRRQLLRQAGPGAPVVTRDDPRARAAAGVGRLAPVRVGVDLAASAVSLRPDRRFLQSLVDAGRDASEVEGPEVPWGLTVAVSLTGKAPRWLAGREGERVMAVHFGIRRDAAWALWEVVADEAVEKAAADAGAPAPAEGDDLLNLASGGRSRTFWRIRSAQDGGPHWAALERTGVVHLEDAGAWAGERARAAARSVAGLGLASEAWSWRRLADLCSSAEHVRRADLLSASLGAVRVAIGAQRDLARSLRAAERGDDEAAEEALRRAAAAWPLPGLGEGPFPEGEGREELLGRLAGVFDERHALVGRLLGELRRRVLYGGHRAAGPDVPSLERMRAFGVYLAAWRSWAATSRDGGAGGPVALPAGVVAKRLAVRRSWAKLLAARVVDAALEAGAAQIVVQDWKGFGPDAGRARSSNARLSEWAIREAIGRLEDLAPLHGIPVRAIEVSSVASWDGTRGGPVGPGRDVPAAEAARVVASRAWQEQLALARATPAGSFFEARARQVLAVDRLLRNPALASARREASVPVPAEWGPRVARFDAELRIGRDGLWSVATADCDINTAVYLGRMGVLRRRLKGGKAPGEAA